MTLEVKNIQFSYKTAHVLKGVDFSAVTGQCVCVLGENGAGKTTLFRCLLGLLKDYQGDVYVDGVNCKKLSTREIAKKIAYIPQARTSEFNYTVFETVLMGTNVLTKGLRTPGQEEREITRRMLDLLHISHLTERGFAELSGGEQQLVFIARALAQKSHVLVMDEPTANLDYGNQFRVMRQVKQLTKSGYLIVMSTHNPEHALLYADTVLVLKEGKTLVYGEPEVILNPALIKNIYGVSVDLQKMHTSWGDVPVFVPCFE